MEINVASISFIAMELLIVKHNLEIKIDCCDTTARIVHTVIKPQILFLFESSFIQFYERTLRIIP